MKKISTLLITLIITILAVAQSPQKMSYQAVIRDAANKLVTNHSVGMRISLLQTSSTGVSVYTETHTGTTNTNGLVTVEIGTGTSSNNFSAINWANGPYFVKTETDPTGGTNYTITGISQLLSVPYALYAKTAENGFSGSYNDLTNKPASIDDDYTNDVNLTGNQVIAGNKTFTGTTAVAAPVNASDAATKGYVDALISQLSIKGVIVADVDGNIYPTIRIGSQVWMGENLKTSKYRDGTAIPNVTSASAWTALASGAYADYGNTPGNSNTYGKLYNYFAVIDAHKLCPTGWHVPSDDEWTTLVSYLGGLSVAGGNLKETGTAHWLTPNTSADNSSGFTALPGGFRGTDGAFYGLGGNAYWWCSTENNATTGWYRIIFYNNSNVTRGNGFKIEGWSVRCLRD